METENLVVEYHEDGGSWWADSPMIPGFLAAGDTLSEVRDQVRGGLEFFIQDVPPIIEVIPPQITAESSQWAALVSLASTTRGTLQRLVANIGWIGDIVPDQTISAH